MYILKIVLSGVGETLMVRFKSKDAADKARIALERPLYGNKDGEPSNLGPILIEDDFGLSVRIPYYSLMLVQYIEFERAVEGDATWQFIQQKIGTKTVEKLKAASPIITPVLGQFGPGDRRI
jgi:hypothetical protein